MTAHDIPNTPENRILYAESIKAQLADFGLREGTVEVWEDGYRAAETADSTFEWWYFDVHLDDGSTLVVTFSNKPHSNPAGPIAPVLLVIRQQPDGTSTRRVVDFPAHEFSAAVDRCDVVIGPNRVAGDLERYEMHLEVEDLVVDLELVRRTPSWRPGAGVTYFDESQQSYLAWVVPVPFGTVAATITEGGETKRLTGGAYHDHNWGNKLMGSYLDFWFWGRAHVGEYTIVYAQLTTNEVPPLGAFNLATLLVADEDHVITDEMLPLRLTTSGEVDGPGQQSYPTRLEWTWETERGRIAFTATNPELIEALDMSADPRADGEPTGEGEHPMYYDFNADLELTIDLDDLKAHAVGRTIYEKMMFH